MEDPILEAFKKSLSKDILAIYNKLLAFNSNTHYRYKDDFYDFVDALQDLADVLSECKEK